MTAIVIIGIYLLICLMLYYVQEHVLFFPEKLSPTHQFKFSGEFEEVNIEMEDGIVLNNVHFKSGNNKRVVLFFHGNGGSVDGWGQGADIYLENDYDVLYVDYRGYGKSNGKIKSENQLINDGQAVYDYLKSTYGEEEIILSGTSIGTGIAVQIALRNKPKKLILNSPYYSLTSLVREKMFLVPNVIIKYKLKTFEHIMNVGSPIHIFHGYDDQLIPVKHAYMLKEKNPEIDLTIIKSHGHNDLFQSTDYQAKMKMVLN